MKTNLEKARYLLDSEDCAWVLCKGDTAVTSCEDCAPALWLGSRENYHIFSAAGKTVDTESARLLCALGVKDVYAREITKEARQILFSQGIAVLWAGNAR